MAAGNAASKALVVVRVAAVSVGTLGALVVCGSVAYRLTRRAGARQRLQELLAASAGADARIVITGADSGIGEALARQLVRHPSVSLVLGCRHVERATRQFCSGESSADLRTKVVSLEMLDFDSVQSFAAKAHSFLQAGSEGLRLLVNCAGVMHAGADTSDHGIGTTWQVNFLGPFLLTELLARHRESAKATRPLCVVNLSSGLESKSQLEMEPLEEETDDFADIYGKPAAHDYADSKRALMLWTSVRAQTLAFKGNVFVHATTPGKVNTRLHRSVMPYWQWLFLKPYRALLHRTPAEGALAAVAAGLRNQATQRFGRYLDGEEQLEDLVVNRMPQKRLAVKLVQWATRVTKLEERAQVFDRRYEDATARKARLRV
eukprot:TRINITY_DN50389_c0_g1_i1.p1 TRINITY_DN50389_c0_g1~~TRINITY_DN50389_c0_g1_i1.p1  ORF type:complete len:376 (+),score=98.20 TRINITY_DN50389_c0_g1_i1:152-1279(+)